MIVLFCRTFCPCVHHAAVYSDEDEPPVNLQALGRAIPVPDLVEWVQGEVTWVHSLSWVMVGSQQISTENPRSIDLVSLFINDAGYRIFYLEYKQACLILPLPR